MFQVTRSRKVQLSPSLEILYLIKYIHWSSAFVLDAVMFSFMLYFKLGEDVFPEIEVGEHF